MNSFATTLLLLSAAAVIMSQTGAAPASPSYDKGYGANVPSLPPFGIPAKHPRYGSSYGGGYGNNEYVTALRYEATNRDSYGIQSSYAYDVDGQKVQVARIDPVKKYY